MIHPYKRVYQFKITLKQSLSQDSNSKIISSHSTPSYSLETCSKLSDTICVILSPVTLTYTVPLIRSLEVQPSYSE